MAARGARWAVKSSIVTVAATGAALAVFASPTVASPVPVGESCDSVTYEWSGSVIVGGDATAVELGVGVPGPVPGETLRVDAVNTDAPVHVSVGGAMVAPGDATSGGSIAVHRDGEPFTLTAIAVEVGRCREVAQAAPPDSAPGAAPVEVIAAPPRSTASLPATGRPVAGPLWWAAAALACGTCLVWATAFGREPLRPRGARRRARG